MSLVETPKARELLHYWEDSHTLKSWRTDPELVACFFDRLIPARVREARTPFGVMLNHRLLALGPRAKCGEDASRG